MKMTQILGILGVLGFFMYNITALMAVPEPNVLLVIVRAVSVGALGACALILATKVAK